jgi:hypothetical protein
MYIRRWMTSLHLPAPSELFKKKLWYVSMFHQLHTWHNTCIYTYICFILCMHVRVSMHMCKFISVSMCTSSVTNHVWWCKCGYCAYTHTYVSILCMHVRVSIHMCTFISVRVQIICDKSSVKVQMWVLPNKYHALCMEFYSLLRLSYLAISFVTDAGKGAKFLFGACEFTCICACMCVCMCVYVWRYIFTCVYICTFLYIHML